jgi:hypothetical protein
MFVTMRVMRPRRRIVVTTKRIRRIPMTKRIAIVQKIHQTRIVRMMTARIQMKQGMSPPTRMARRTMQRPKVNQRPMKMQ